MPFLLNLVYLLALFILSPWLLYKFLTTGKYRRGLLRKFLGLVDLPAPNSPRIWFHGVSVGEIHLLRHVVARFRQSHPNWECVLSTTTDTGFDEARKHFPDLSVVYWPLDFSWAVRRALRRINPSLIVLAEGELWPNFLIAAKRRGIPVAVINGRLSPRSFRRYRRFGGLVRWLFGHVDLFAMQTADYAGHIRELGGAAERVKVTGSVKFDGVQTERANPRTQELRCLLGVETDDLVWTVGSTQPPEEEIALDIFRRVKVEHPNLRLFLVPRQKDRFDEVARLLERSNLPFVRRSALDPRTSILDPRSSVILVDTIGELGALWGLADIAYVGGSLDGRRGGQNMIEPAAYGAVVLFGPHVWNFRDTAARLVEAGAARQVADAAALETALRQLLDDADGRQRMGSAARQFVLRQQGATEHTVALLDELLANRPGRMLAA